MAQITLNPGESFTAADGFNTISGTTGGRETITITGGVHVLTPDFNAGGDRIVLAGPIGQYQISLSGSSIVLYSKINRTQVTVPAPNPNLADALNPVISFTSGAVRDFVLDSTPDGVFTLGGTRLSPYSYINPNPISVSVSGTDLVEGSLQNSGQQYVVFTLSEPIAIPVTLNVTIAGGSAIGGGVDYSAGGPLAFFGGTQTQQSFTIFTSADQLEEGRETIVLHVTSSDPDVPIAPFDVVVSINDTTITDYSPVSLGTGQDVYADPRNAFFGALQPGQTGKLLSADDRIVGTGASAVIRLTDPSGRSVIDDVDFTGVSNVGTLQTNFGTVRLGAQAMRAGIVSVQTQFLTDTSNLTAAGIVRGGTLVDLTGDANGDGRADFDVAVSALLANSAADTVRLTLRSSEGSSIDTGMTFAPVVGAPVGPIDTIQIVGETNPVRITLPTVGQVGDGTPYDPSTRTLSVRAQATGADGALIGAATRFDDEGIRFTGATFTVGTGASRGPSYGEVILGTALGDVLTATAAPAYIVGGAGNDRITGGSGADTLIGGTGADTFVYTAAAQSSSTGYDTIVDFTYGSDMIDLPGSPAAASRLTTGRLNATTLDADLQTALSDALGAGGAVLFTANRGDLSGATFLVADGNGVAGYQAGEDFLIRLPDAPAMMPSVLIV